MNQLQNQSKVSVVQEMLEANNVSPKQVTTWKKSDVPRWELPQHIKQDAFLWNAFRRLHYKDENFLCVVVGETGAGKSISTIALSDMLDITPKGDEKFTRNLIVKDNGQGVATPECRVVFTAKDFLRLVRNNLPRGSVIIWDEAGVEQDNTEWYEKKSKLIKKVFQTFRFKNLAVFFTVPDLESIMVGTRRLIHCVISVEERFPDMVKARIEWQQRVRWRGKTMTFMKTQYTEDAFGEKTKMIPYYIRPARKELVLPYERIKHRITDNWYKFYKEEIEEMDEELQDEKLLSYEESKYKKFDILRCTKLIRENQDTLIDGEGQINRGKIQFFLAERGFACGDRDVKKVLDNL